MRLFESTNTSYPLIYGNVWQGSIESSTPGDEYWSYLRFLSIESECISILKTIHGINGKSLQRRMANNIRSFVLQADEYYKAAKERSSRTSPLLYYYSMLNLAKVLLTIYEFQKLKQRPYLYHGLSDADVIKKQFDFRREKVRIQNRGIFPLLYKYFAGFQLPAQTLLSIKELLSYCLECDIEFLHAYGSYWRVVDINHLLAGSSKTKRTWVVLAVPREEYHSRIYKLKDIFEPIRPNQALYEAFSLQDQKGRRFFQTLATYPYTDVDDPPDRLNRKIAADLRPLCLYSAKYTGGNLKYSLPLPSSAGVVIPQAIAIYGVMFYLGSLVRYQPHTYDRMLTEKDAWVLESFLRNCPIGYVKLILGAIFKKEFVIEAL